MSTNLSRFVIYPDGQASGPRGTPVSIYESSDLASAGAAAEIAAAIRAKAAVGQAAVLGLATGSTPVGVYEELVRLHREDGLSFKNVMTFNLDEYWPMHPDALQSYHRFMREHLFDRVDIPAKNVNIPDGTLKQEDIGAFCADYERRIERAGGIDIQILGIGRTGHIGFNEPGSPRDSRTRLITLDKVTRMDAASDFFGEWNVPKRAITMGVGTILAARRVLLLAFGESKARIIRQALEGPITRTVAASFLQEHGNAEFVLDGASASELTPIKTPWLLGPLAERGLAWDAKLTRRAVIWLAQEVKKPILKLVAEDYNEHGLQELLSERGAAYDVNIAVFRALSGTITGWPGGKPKEKTKATSVVGAIRHASEAFPKRVVVFSPHPDDDVISMGGTLIRLCDQGHDVHVAYQTSGNIAVFDEEAVRYADFISEFAADFKTLNGQTGEGETGEQLEARIRQFVHSKRAGEIDTPELQKIKTFIRRSEARAAARYSGCKLENIHFLDMPFYETGRVRKNPLGERDIQIIVDLLNRVRPQQVYAAGDLSDPHGTHRVCLRAVLTALERLRAAAAKGDEAGERDGAGGRDASAGWVRECDVWLYRGAWQEWEPESIEMAVPLSPDEVDRKRMAIFKHQSQKDRALFPGPWDTREFWERAEERNRATAETYDRLGLPEYQAIEAFVRWG